MKSNSIRMKAMLTACAILLSMTLTSCTAFMKEASLDTTALSNGTVMPVVEGFMKNDSINDKLSDAFLPVAEYLHPFIEESDGVLRIEYSMNERKSGLFGSEYGITMYLSDDRNSIELKSVTLSGLDSVKADDSGDYKWINSADIAQSALILLRYGVDFDRGALDEYSDEKFALETFIKLYEGFAGRETDVSELVVSGDDLYKKSLLLGLINYYRDDEYQYDQRTYVYSLSSVASKILALIERDVYGRQSEIVTGEEFGRIINTLHKAMPLHEAEGYEKRWSDLGGFDTDEILETMEMTNTPFTRRDAAEMIGRITKGGPKYSRNFNDHNLIRVEDAYDSIWVRRAVSHDFMNYYGDSTVFAPDAGFTLVNAISNAQVYLNTRFVDWVQYTDYQWDEQYSKGDVIISAAQIAKYFDDRTDEDKAFEVKTVINDRDYNWFYSQMDTGEYSAINCMPSIATMAAHWYDENSDATVIKMRETSNYYDGWTAYQLRCGLSAYNVPFTVEVVNIDNIVKALDEGKIVLAQYSDRPIGVSGHCYVIYGYRRFKNSTTFIVNDSDSLTNRAEIFGRKMGNGDEIEAVFSMWSISRFVDDVTVIGRDDD